MKKPFCGTCDYVGEGNQAEGEASCPNCGTPLTQPTPEPKASETSRSIGFGTEKTSSPRRKTGWG